MEENRNSRQISLAMWTILLLLAVAEIVISLDGNQYWHDVRFSYVATEFSLAEVLSGVFNPHQAWLESDEISSAGFYLSKVLHITLLHFLYSAVDPDAGGFDLAITLSVLFTVCTIILAYLFYARLLRSNKIAGLAAICLLMAPVIPYLSGKILSESTSLLFVIASLLLMVKANDASDSKRFLLAVFSGLFLTMAALARLDSLFGPIGFIFASLIVPLSQGGRDKQIINIAIVLLTFVVTYISTLLTIGVNPEILLDYYLAFVNADQKSIVMSLLGIASFGGSIYLLVIAGLFSKQSRATRFFLLWFSITTIPVLLITWNYMVEPRYLIQGLLPLCALGAYSIKRFLDSYSAREKFKLILVSVFIVMTIGLNYLLVRIMPYELDKHAMEEMISSIKEVDPEASIMVPWSYTDFNFLKLVYDDTRIFNVNSSLDTSIDEGVNEFWKSRFHHWYGEQYISEQAKLDELLAEGPVYYLGWTKYPPVQNVQNFTNTIGLTSLSALLNNMQLTDHRKTSWLWASPEYDLLFVDSSGQYEYYRVEHSD